MRIKCVSIYKFFGFIKESHKRYKSLCYKGFMDFDLLKLLLKDVESELGINIIYLIYNEQEEICRAHIPKIKKFLEKINYDSVIVILEGIGGESSAGKLLALELRHKFREGYFVAIPNFIRSALVFPIFAASTIFMDSYSTVGPVEPLKRTSSGWKSTLNLMRGDNSGNRSKILWMNQANDILFLLHIPESIVHEINGLSMNKIENITKLFLCSQHDRKIFKSDLKKLGFYCWEVEGKEYWEKLKRFTNQLKSELIKNKTISFIIGDINSYNMIK